MEIKQKSVENQILKYNVHKMEYIYLTYGFFDKDLNNLILLLDNKLSVKLSNENIYEEDKELYYLSEENGAIKDIHIFNGSELGYHYSINNVLYPNYLLHCTLCSSDKEEITLIRKAFENMPHIQELNVFIQEAATCD